MCTLLSGLYCQLCTIIERFPQAYLVFGAALHDLRACVRLLHACMHGCIHGCNVHIVGFRGCLGSAS